MIILIFCVGLLTLTPIEFAQGKPVEDTQNRDGLTIHKAIATWEEAQLICQKEGAILASPINTDLLNEMKALIGVNDAEYFIGVKERQYLGPYVSEEGVSLDNMTSAVMDMIHHIDPYDGECLSMDRCSIRVVSCCRQLPFICYKSQTEYVSPTTETTTSTEQDILAKPAGTMDCGTNSEGYELYNSTGSCYKKHTEPALWDEAQSKCVSEGGHLAIVNDRSEADIIKNMYYPRNVPWYIYIGFRNYGPDRGWESVEGESVSGLYNSWINGIGLKSPVWACGLFKYTRQLDWDICAANKHPFLCEKPIKYY